MPLSFAIIVEVYKGCESYKQRLQRAQQGWVGWVECLKSIRAAKAELPRLLMITMLVLRLESMHFSLHPTPALPLMFIPLLWHTFECLHWICIWTRQTDVSAHWRQVVSCCFFFFALCAAHLGIQFILHVCVSVCGSVCVLLKSRQDAANVTDVSQLIAAAAWPSRGSFSSIQAGHAPIATSKSWILNESLQQQSQHQHQHQHQLQQLPPTWQRQRQRQWELAATWLGLTWLWHAAIGTQALTFIAFPDSVTSLSLNPSTPLPLHPLLPSPQSQLNVEPQSDWHQMNTASVFNWFYSAHAILQGIQRVEYCPPYG